MTENGPDGVRRPGHHSRGTGEQNRRQPRRPEARSPSRWRQWAKGLKTRSLTLFYAYRDPQTPWYAKVVCGLVVAYAFSPIDLIPDFIPILGYLDDLILLPLGIALAIRLIPRDVLGRAEERARAAADARRPVSWIAAGVIIALWVGIAAAVVIRLFFSREIA